MNVKINRLKNAFKKIKKKFLVPGFLVLGNLLRSFEPYRFKDVARVEGTWGALNHPPSFVSLFF